MLANKYDTVILKAEQNSFSKNYILRNTTLAGIDRMKRELSIQTQWEHVQVRKVD